MGNQSRCDNTEVEINDEDIDVSRKFLSSNRAGFRAKNQRQDDDPYDNNDHLEDERCKRSFEVDIFRDPPELEMP